MMRRLSFLRTVCMLSAFLSGAMLMATAAATDLIPREVFFGNPQRSGAQISPDGTRLAFLAPRDGVLNVWVAPLDDLDRAQPVTSDRTTGIRQYFWAYNNRHILFLQDRDGDEDFHLYRVELSTLDTIDLTPMEKISAQVLAVSHRFPDEALVLINDRNMHFYHDVFRINVTTGERARLFENDSYVGFVADDDFRVRLAVQIDPLTVSMKILEADPQAEGGWKPLDSVQPEDLLTTSPVGFDKTGDTLYLVDSRGRNTAALVARDMASGQNKVLFESPVADLAGALAHPTEKTVQAVRVNYLRDEWIILDPAIDEDFKFLRTVSEGDFNVANRSLDDRHWIVTYVLDNGPAKTFHYDRTARQARFLFSNRPELEDLPLCRMHPIVIRSRDGLDLVSYLSIPLDADPEQTGRPSAPLPMVLLVHGGPWARDDWGYDSLHQMLTNRGYAVLSVNYRGSTGFGKAFINAANKEWAGKMHDDLIDAVDWAVHEGIAVRDRVAIMGGSYGGYATLVGLTFTPEVFACGVDLVGPSSLISLLNNPPPYWTPTMPMMRDRVGDWTSDAGQEELKARSPLYKVEAIRRPLLIGQGGQDPRVKKQESDQIVQAMQARKTPVTYVLYPTEGHGFDRPEHNISFFAIAEAFLAQHLGGRSEPFGYAFRDAEFEIPAGAEQVPGLQQALGDN